MQKKHPAADVRLITKAELCRRLAASEASVDRWLRSDPSFPQARRLGPGSIRWVEDEVVRFILELTHVAYEDHGFDPNGKMVMEEL
ncbi:helix-turn-helix transcriptional regulator [Paracoccus marcusii]|uniref:AlpA family phage regulatory protein n=1 Tax=Paracoccus marcusii TaxID=59779 RepID=A0ABY7UQV5_9RHOB|nr:AlpA family phage regulatory protein [Paracoccus marcusii]WDA11816.1 AlpA family phage regulatory protein [Paracoccus marcusii]